MPPKRNNHLTTQQVDRDKAHVVAARAKAARAARKARDDAVARAACAELDAWEANAQRAADTRKAAEIRMVRVRMEARREDQSEAWELSAELLGKTLILN